MSEFTVGMKRGREQLSKPTSTDRKDSTIVTRWWMYPVFNHTKEAGTVSALSTQEPIVGCRGVKIPFIFGTVAEPCEDDGATSVEESSAPRSSSSCVEDDDYLIGGSFSFEDFGEDFEESHNSEMENDTLRTGRCAGRYWAPDEEYEPEVEIFDFEM